MTIAVSRRAFLKASTAVGGGLALQFRFPVASAAAPDGVATEVNAWIVIHPDDRVTIRIARSEMGQGSYTALAQLVAEELDCDWAKASAEFASPNEHIRRNRIWGSMSTGGSQGIRSSHNYVRKAGASAREMLIAAAAAQWKVPADQCSAAGCATGKSRRRPPSSHRRRT
jgi:isoquinoline 1-oxidoreductase beta subunit